METALTVNLVTALPLEEMELDELKDLRNDLKEKLDAAQEAMSAAWDAANRTTVEEGFTVAQFHTARLEAETAERWYKSLWRSHDAVCAALVLAATESEIDPTPLGGW